MLEFQISNKSPRVACTDISDEIFRHLMKAKVIAWDIETSGLDWTKNKIASCQLFSPRGPAVLVRIDESVPKNLKLLLENKKVKKIFHHATFDLGFMAHHWNCQPANIGCTKVASKILSSEKSESHSLKDLLNVHLGIAISKELATSNWFAENLTAAQIQYAINDVLYLPSLFQALKKKLVQAGKWDLALASFRYLPTRVALNITNIGDVFTY